MNVSIVIPVYNEAEQLGACLQAIARQTVRPYQVIVVDNNSTDGTAAIAAAFDFVSVLHEPRQGVVHGRTRGFNAARGEIIGRIDADTLLPPGWVAQVQAIFADQSVSAVSGAPHYYDFALAGIADAIDIYMRARLARKLHNTNFLWGANMAVRRSAWLQTRHLLCEKPGLHEDFDLAIHLQEAGLEVAYDGQLVAGVSSRRIDSSWLAYARYTLASPRTYAWHRLKTRRHMYPVILVCWLAYLPGRVIYRGYNPETGVFSLSQLLTAAPQRVDPTANIV
jgi:glycosyltransferase involved in cell wall biosynthesis